MYLLQERRRYRTENKWYFITNSYQISVAYIATPTSGRTQNEHFSERNALSSLDAKLYESVEKNNSNMAYNDSWSTWEQKGRAEPRREKKYAKSKNNYASVHPRTGGAECPLINLLSPTIRYDNCSDHTMQSYRRTYEAVDTSYLSYKIEDWLNAI